MCKCSQPYWVRLQDGRVVKFTNLLLARNYALANNAISVVYKGRTIWKRP